MRLRRRRPHRRRRRRPSSRRPRRRGAPAAATARRRRCSAYLGSPHTPSPTGLAARDTAGQPPLSPATGQARPFPLTSPCATPPALPSTTAPPPIPPLSPPPPPIADPSGRQQRRWLAEALPSQAAAAAIGAGAYNRTGRAVRGRPAAPPRPTPLPPAHTPSLPPALHRCTPLLQRARIPHFHSLPRPPPRLSLTRPARGRHHPPPAVAATGAWRAAPSGGGSAAVSAACISGDGHRSARAPAGRARVGGGRALAAPAARPRSTPLMRRAARRGGTRRGPVGEVTAVADHRGRRDWMAIAMELPPPPLFPPILRQPPSLPARVHEPPLPLSLPPPPSSLPMQPPPRLPPPLRRSMSVTTRPRPGDVRQPAVVARRQAADVPPISTLSTA